MIDCGSHHNPGSFCGEVKISQLADAIDDHIGFDGGMRRICEWFLIFWKIINLKSRFWPSAWAGNRRRDRFNWGNWRVRPASGWRHWELLQFVIAEFACLELKRTKPTEIWNWSARPLLLLSLSFTLFETKQITSYRVIPITTTTTTLSLIT